MDHYEDWGGHGLLESFVAYLEEDDVLPHPLLESDVDLGRTCECLERHGEGHHGPRGAKVPYGHIHGTFLGMQRGEVPFHAWDLPVHHHHHRNGEETADVGLPCRNEKNWDLDAPFGLRVLQMKW